MVLKLKCPLSVSYLYHDRDMEYLYQKSGFSLICNDLHMDTFGHDRQDA